MRPHEIVEGGVYIGGEVGFTRRVTSIEYGYDGPRKASMHQRVRYETTNANVDDGTVLDSMRLSAFARWARKRVTG